MRKKTKFLLLRATVIALFAILAGRVWYIQVVMGSYYQKQGDTSKMRLLPVQALRGIIYDRSGQQLVWNAPSWNVEIVPHGIPSMGASAIYNTLATLLHNQPRAAQIAQLVRANQWRAYEPVVVKGNVSTDTAMIIKQFHSQLPGVEAEPSSVRQYVADPTGNFALSHILGYTVQISPEAYATNSRAYPKEHIGENDVMGGAGIEMSLDPYLHGVNGTQEVEVDAGERPVRVIRPGKTVPGDSIYLTIDWPFEQQVESDLAAALNKLGLHQGVAVVEDVHTGAILAMVSLPSYDDNWFSGGISQKRFAALMNNPDHPLIDLATAGQFPPGSTFKLITGTAALQTGVVNVDTYIDDTGSINLGVRTFYGWKAGGLGPMNIVSAISHSSDIYMYTVAGGNPVTNWGPGIGAERLAAYARMFGLGQKTGIQLPDEMPGFVPSPSWYNSLKPGSTPIRPAADYTWHIGDTYNMAIGQGYNLETPLQMVNVAATIANGGTVYQPQILEKIVGRVVPRVGVSHQNQTIQPFVPAILRRNFISPGNLALIQQGMHEAVTLPNWQGTGYLVQDPRVDAAGKTGTAEVGDLPPHAWWVGYAPFNNPQVAISVLVPNAGGEGAYVAAPIAHKILEDYFHLPAAKPKTPGPCGCWLDDVQQVLVGNTGGSQ